ncbi:MAG: NTP transferase domain-containing protein [Candidatus Diapherotrites archaeon]|nr:NTP transferase domain-containing protein [Candidatus Diapherotrites archaeon]
MKGVEKLVVLAAGKGVRMQPLTLEKPKALVELNGKPLIEHVLEAFEYAGISKAVIVVGYKKEAIIEYLGKKWNSIAIEYAYQNEPKGTANALIQAEKYLEHCKKFATANSDVIIDKTELKRIVNEASKLLESNEAVIVARKSKEPWKYGCLLVEGNRLREIVEKPERGKEPSNLINAGYYFFTPKIFEFAKKVKPSSRGEYEITDAINMLAAEGKVAYIKTKKRVFDIGTIAELKEAEKILKV